MSQPTIELTMGWLLGKVMRFDNRVHTLVSGWGHYPTIHEVIPLFVSAEETLRRISRLPKIPSMGSIRRGRMRQLHTITGGMTSSQTSSSMIGCGPI